MNQLVINNFSVKRGSFTLSPISLTIQMGEIFAILGRTGSGKTVLLEAISGMFPGDTGSILLDGTDIRDIPPSQRKLGLVYQDYGLFPHMKVKENISYGLKMHGYSKKEQDSRAQELMEMLSISHIGDQYPGTLSGGESQRTALARALALAPQVLLLDEPFSALDPATRQSLYQELRRIHRHFGCTIIFVTHDMDEAIKLAGRISGDGGHTALFYPAAKPMQAPAGYDLYTEVRKHDVLLAYPYQSIRPFIKMLLRAGADPDVVSIKMTLYRMASDSQIVNALIAAAENGKEVVAMVELRARFDEQNNIDWSKQLEDAGCTVFYGFDDYKVHSKLTLITSRVNGQYKYLTQIGTGNYNEKTSELYTDLSFITTRQEIGEEASAVFNNMALQRLTSEADTMLVAPLRFKTVLLEEMDRQIALAMQGKPASIILKNNSINDPQIIDKISEASCAGVRVDMIVRGICCVRAGVPGRTENVHIRSLVGRYLEHSRIYCFGSGETMRIYIASGDFLTRNTERRVEVGVRVDDPAIAKKLRGILDLQLRDTVNAREMQPDGTYVKVPPAEGQPPVDSQMAMFGYFQNGFAQETDKPEKPKAESKPKAAAVKAAVKPVPRQRAALRPKRAGLLQSLFGRGKK